MLSARRTSSFVVAVTGVGALIGQGICRGLRADGRARIVGIDRISNLAAEAVCDKLVCKPQVSENSTAYLDFWRRLVIEHQVDLILPGIGVDVVFFDKNRGALQDLPVILGLNTSQLIDLTSDKLRFSEACAVLNLPQIPTVRPTTWAQAIAELGPPPILRKPRRGEGSSGIHLLYDEHDFAYWTRGESDTMILQRIIGRDSEEFTVGVFGMGDGSKFEPIVMRRRLTRSGHTGSAQVIDAGTPAEADIFEALSCATQKLVRHFKPVGPTNLQFRMEDGRPYLLEINPRFSSSCSLRVLFGYNEAAMCIDFFLERRPPLPPTILVGRAERYNADLVKYAHIS